MSKRIEAIKFRLKELEDLHESEITVRLQEELDELAKEYELEIHTLKNKIQALELKLAVQAVKT